MNYSPKFKRALIASYGGDKDAIDIFVLPSGKRPPTPLELVEIPLDEKKEPYPIGCSGIPVPSKKRKDKDIDLTVTDDETESEEEPTTSDEEAITSASECSDSEYSLDSEEEREYREAKPCRKRPKLEFSKAEIEALIEKKAQELIDKKARELIKERAKEITELEALLD